MNPKIARRGSRTLGLLAYLYGPGLRDQHTDPHLVASWDDTAPDPGRDEDALLRDLARVLDQPVQVLPERHRPRRHVWHCSVRAAPEDRLLTDAEWATIARRVVAATGIAPEGDVDACRWAAVRHADDHIHIVATLVREDGRRPRLDKDAARAQAECRQIERDFGLRRLNPGDGTAAPRPTSAERFKAERHQRQRTPREQLREAVRQAVAGASSQDEFFARLSEQGLLVRQRHAPSGDLLGYTVALVGDHDHRGEPVWFSGTKLAPDLSWPRIRARLGPHVTVPAVTPVRARADATDATWTAASILDQDDAAAAAQLVAAGELLDALTITATAPTRAQIAAAARVFERAARSHIHAAHAQARALHRAARSLALAGTPLGRGPDGAATAMLLSALILLVVAGHTWHATRAHHQQAAAALQAAEHLRSAYDIAAARPIATLRERGRQLPPQRHARHTATLRAALPEAAERVLAEPGWHALAATLEEIEGSGGGAEALLLQSARHRELASAHSISEVLTWRLRHLGHLPHSSLSRSGTTARRREDIVRPTSPPGAPRPGAG
ncbi:relaxase/mobilization nuclease domain-containing protein [Streptomyces hainanensis]|uniref:Mobilization protein n=1 Tax=Streptomyces hainanensis TaxID=402648 RepID=A0A4R4TIY5_9ACTN|nr:relaxase/mobilization nuclease domain-containing protein [Streptomyces hainanensis]TDC75694.1 mobilization protein [Streptomyces hainanensis]